MLAGFLLVLVSLVFGGFDGIWRGLVVAGIALALLGVAWSARRPHRPARRQRGGWWRDRYITYDDPESPSRPFLAATALATCALPNTCPTGCKPQPR